MSENKKQTTIFLANYITEKRNLSYISIFVHIVVINKFLTLLPVIITFSPQMLQLSFQFIVSVKEETVITIAVAVVAVSTEKKMENNK